MQLCKNTVRYYWYIAYLLVLHEQILHLRFLHAILTYKASPMKSHSYEMQIPIRIWTLSWYLDCVGLLCLSASMSRSIFISKLLSTVFNQDLFALHSSLNSTAHTTPGDYMYI